MATGRFSGYLCETHPAFLSLAFAPGEAAQVDWGCAGIIEMGNTRRQLSFFVMVLCHSRMAYLEFTCGECLEHFLACHQNALEFFGGSPTAAASSTMAKPSLTKFRFLFEKGDFWAGPERLARAGS